MSIRVGNQIVANYTPPVASATTSTEGKVRLATDNEATAGVSTTTVITPAQLSTGLGTVQATLVSGINIKTINNTSILGSGNIATGTVVSVNNISPVDGNVTLSIPSEVTESTVSAWGFTKNVGTVTSVNSVTPDANGNVVLSIPTVNNSTITFTQGGVTKGSFTLNQSSAGTIALDAGGGDSLPSQTGHAGGLLTTDGADASWGDTAEIIPVIETYSNGTSFYRIWAADSTGYRYCVQGSTYYKGSSIAGDNTVEFLKEFTNTNYSFTPTLLHSNTNLNTYSLIEKYPSRTTSQTVIYVSSAAFGYSWIARGHIKDDV